MNSHINSHMNHHSSHFLLKSCNIVTPDAIKAGFLEIKDHKIVHFHESIVHDTTLTALPLVDYGLHTVMPGFIDIHVHGWGRGSFAHKGDDNALKFMSKDIVKTGVTSYLATSAVMPTEFLNRSLIAAKRHITESTPQTGAEVIGVHMEGPYINIEYIGMQSKDGIQLPSIESFDAYNECAGNHVKLMTLAPEIEGALPLIRHLKKIGVTSSAGHTAATFEQITHAIEAGLDHFTHAFSAMRGFHHRELGVVGALMYYEDAYAEVGKQTGMTIKNEAFDILYRIKKDRRLVLMSDCIGYADFPEGYEFYHYLRKENFKVQNQKLVVTSDSGQIQTIDPSCYANVKNLEMSFVESIRNILPRVKNGWLSIAKIACENPAHLAKAADRKGRLAVGYDADIVILDENIQIIDVYCRGYKQYLDQD